MEDFIGTRTGAQIRSHAQKYFMRIEKELNCSGLAFPSADHSIMGEGDYGNEEEDMSDEGGDQEIKVINDGSTQNDIATKKIAKSSSKSECTLK